MHLFFGESYLNGAIPLLVLSGAQLISTTTGGVGMLLIMTGHQKQWALISVASLAIGVASSWLLIPGFGINGAAMAAAIAISVLYLSGLFMVKQKINIWPYDKRYIKGMIAGFASIVVVFIFKNAVVQWGNSLMQVTVLLLMSLLAFWGTYFVLGDDPEDREIRQIIVRKVKATRLSPFMK
jgi:O-antigen/teichoic acid export membrane protein